MSFNDIPDGDESARMEVRTLLAFIWAGRRLIGFCIALFLVLGYFQFRMAPRTYEGDMLLSAAASSTQANTSNNPLSGAARLIGLGGNTGQPEYVKFQALLTSSALAKRLAAKPGVLQILFASRWDNEAKAWKEPTGIGASARSWLRYLLDRPAQHDPGANDVLRLLRNDLTQDLSLQTSLLKISTESTNPEYAKNLLSLAHREADNILRDAARQRSVLRIRYLQSTLEKINAVEQRQSLIQLLSQEEQSNMMIESDPNYGADIVDPPYVSPDPVSPQLPVTIIVALLLGFAVGLALHIFRRVFDWKLPLPAWLL